jgi:hypothetical protein
MLPTFGPNRDWTPLGQNWVVIFCIWDFSFVTLHGALAQELFCDFTSMSLELNYL